MPVTIIKKMKFGTLVEHEGEYVVRLEDGKVVSQGATALMATVLAGMAGYGVRGAYSGDHHQEEAPGH